MNQDPARFSPPSSPAVTCYPRDRRSPSTPPYKSRSLPHKRIKSPFPPINRSLVLRCAMLSYTSIAEAEAALGRGLTGMEALWFWYSAGMSDFALHSHSSVFLLIVYTLVPLPVAVIELTNPKAIYKYKLQPKVKNSVDKYVTCYVNCVKMYIFGAIPMQLLSYPIMKAIGIRTSLPLPSATEVVSQLIVYFLIEDYLNYWIHRLMHRKWAYDLMHHVHHEYTTPIGFAGPYLRLAEVPIDSSPVLAGPVLVPGHIVTLWLWFIIRQVVALVTHCGYDFPYTPAKFIPLLVSAEYHDYHHYVGGHSQGNFGPVFTYCDYLYGTDKGYKYQKEHLRKLRERWKYNELHSETNGKLD